MPKFQRQLRIIFRNIAFIVDLTALAGDDRIDTEFQPMTTSLVHEETRRMVQLAASVCEEKKGEETRILELDPIDSGLADFFLLTSASNDRQSTAIADEIELRLKREFGVYAHSVEGRRAGEWILLDYVDFVVHVFLAERRAFYDIERLRKSANPFTPAEFDASLKAQLSAKTLDARSKQQPPTKTKPAAKKTAAAKPAPSKAPVKQAAPVKPVVPAKPVAPAKVAKKAVAKKTPAKAVVKKAVSKKTPAKAVVKKAVGKKAPAKVFAKKAAAKKAVKAPVRKPVVKAKAKTAKPTVKKAVSKKVIATKVAVKKTVAKKAPAKAVAKKAVKARGTKIPARKVVTAKRAVAAKPTKKAVKKAAPAKGKTGRKK